jgi:hypothetical protein
MRYDKTTVLTVPGLYEFSGIVSAALKECARVYPSAVFSPQFSLVDDTAELGGIQETKQPLCVGRKLGRIPHEPAASVWTGIIADENVRFAVTVDGADAAYIANLKENLAKSENTARLNEKPPRTNDPQKCCIYLRDDGCDKVFSSNITQSEKQQIIAGFFHEVDALLHNNGAAAAFGP